MKKWGPWQLQRSAYRAFALALKSVWVGGGIAMFVSCSSIHQRAEVSSWPSSSLFHLDSQWTRHDGAKVPLSSLAASAKIVSMVFLRCTYSCPITVEDMKEMERLMEAKNSSSRGNGVKDYGLVLISIDPDHDSPEAMRRFAVERKLDLTKWTILTSSSGNIRELAAALGFSYKKDEAMEFAHSMLTWVLDREGVVRFVRTGRKQSAQETVEALAKVAD